MTTVYKELTAALATVERWRPQFWVSHFLLFSKKNKQLRRGLS